MSSFVELVRSVAGEVAAHADALNRLDGHAGDGDLGVTTQKASAAVLVALPSAEDTSVQDVLRACGLQMANAAPSTCGTLIATALLRAAAALDPDDTGDARSLAVALDAARAGVAELGKAEPGSKTMLDALAPAAEAASRTAAAGESLDSVLEAATLAAHEGAQATASMLPKHGRASWLAERSAGHEDAGARLVAIILASALAYRTKPIGAVS